MERYFKFSTNSTSVEFLAKSTFYQVDDSYLVYRNDNTSALAELISNKQENERISLEIYKISSLEKEIKTVGFKPEYKKVNELVFSLEKKSICYITYATGQDFFYIDFD